MNAPEMRQDALPAAGRACDYCGSLFTAKRAWSRFCNGRCRAAFHAQGGHVTRKEHEDLKRRVAALEAKSAT